MTDVTRWSETPIDNATADPDINWSEGQLPGTVNNSARTMMAAIKRRELDLSGSVVSTGAANVYAMATRTDLASLTDGLTLTWRAHQTNTAAATFNPDGLGANSIVRSDGSALQAGDIIAGCIYTTTYVLGSTHHRLRNVMAVTGVNGDGFSPFRNRILNPSGTVVQIVLGLTADDNYGFDQWIVLTQSNPITPSILVNAENGTPVMMRYTQSNAAAQRFGVLQPIEAIFCNDLRGKTVTLSARVRMSASTTLRYAIIEWTGSADALTSDVVNDWTSGTFTTGNFFISTTTTIAGTGSTVLTANTLTDVALTASISGSMNNISVFFWTDSTQAQNVTFDIAKVQLEIGGVATTYSPRPYSLEQILCARYYEQIGASSAGGWASSTTATIGVNFKAPKRTTPSLSLTSSAPTILEVGTAVRAGSGSALTPQAASINGAAVDINGFTSVTVPEAAVMTGDFIIVSAQL